MERIGLEVGENRSRRWEQKWVSEMEQKKETDNASDKAGFLSFWRRSDFENFEKFEKLAENAVRASIGASLRGSLFNPLLWTSW